MLQTLFTVIPGLMISMYVKMQLDIYEWKSESIRKIVAFSALMVWALAFGAFCGFTGFLRS